MYGSFRKMFVFTKIYRTYGSFLIWKYFNKCSVYIDFILITHIHNWLPFHTFRRRCYVCSFFDYKYVGSNKNEGKDWNNRFIYFIQFLCGLTPQLAIKLSELCALESSQLLLFQKSKAEILQVWCPSNIVYFSSLCFLIFVMFVRLVTIWGLITRRKTLRS